MASRAARDHGLFQIGKATRWLAVGTVVGGGLLSAAVAKALPGRSPQTAANQTSPGSAAPAAPSSPLGGSGSQGVSAPASGSGSSQLTAPQQAPQPVINQPVAVSGGS